MAENYFDTDKMAEIILTLTKKFSYDRIINYLLDRLIRNESDHLPLLHKSKEVSKLEEQYKISIAGLSRIQTRNIQELKGKIIIEHGLPESQAIEMCSKSNNKEEIKTLLEELKNNLVCITVDEDRRLERGKCRRKGPSGFYWEEEYKKCGIIVVKNTLPNTNTISAINGNLSKKQAMAIVNQKHGQYLNDSNTMFSTINQNVKQWSFNRKNFHFNDDTHMILINQNTRELHYFFIKGGIIADPSKTFDQRNDKRVKDSSIIRIPVSTFNFKEEKSEFPFGKYKVDTISF